MPDTRNMAQRIADAKASGNDDIVALAKEVERLMAIVGDDGPEDESEEDDESRSERFDASEEITITRAEYATMEMICDLACAYVEAHQKKDEKAIARVYPHLEQAINENYLDE